MLPDKVWSRGSEIPHFDTTDFAVCASFVGKAFFEVLLTGTAAAAVMLVAIVMPPLEVGRGSLIRSYESYDPTGFLSYQGDNFIRCLAGRKENQLDFGPGRTGLRNLVPRVTKALTFPQR